jgi:glutamyl-Q tRNA(Asp) synthetase
VVESDLSLTYRGRFAPSPTGPLHFGSLVAAVGSFLQARSQGGLWHVRIENLDPPRESPTAADQILQALDHFGLYWDGTVVFQSDRLAAYQAALETLRDRGLTYCCLCSRKDLTASSKSRIVDPDLGPVYPGTCRNRRTIPRGPHSIRLKTTNDAITFEDAIQGRFEQRLDQVSGDFVVRRRDGPFSYQLAVVVDDWAQNITEVVRGIDLLSQTPRQIFLQRCLGITTPRYAHLPIVVDATGQKLSKQTGAADVRALKTRPVLWQALSFLRQRPPDELQRAPPLELLAWATANWQPERLRGHPRRTVDTSNHNLQDDV